MLPKDAEQWHQQAVAEKQQCIDPHLVEKLQKQSVVPYSNAIFQGAAIEWLVSTDQVSVKISLFSLLFTHGQPIQAFQHPSFQNMVHIAARATNGIKIPDHRQTREAIINSLKQQMTALRNHLNVRLVILASTSFINGLILQSDAMKGKVSLTCDAWQVSNSDGYFAVTGSWIEQDHGKWQIKPALLGFTQLNNAHNGMWLGQ